MGTTLWIVLHHPLGLGYSSICFNEDTRTIIGLLEYDEPIQSLTIPAKGAMLEFDVKAETGKNKSVEVDLQATSGGMSIAAVEN